MLDEKSRSFAKACIQNGIEDLNTPANREKAKLIAKQNHLDDYENIQYLQKTINEYTAEVKAKE